MRRSYDEYGRDMWEPNMTPAEEAAWVRMAQQDYLALLRTWARLTAGRP